MIEGQPLRCEGMTGLQAGRLADLIGRVREIVGDEWEKPPVGRPHVLPLPTAVIAVLSGLRRNQPDEVLGEMFGCSQATITRYHQILQPILRWVTCPEVDQRFAQTGIAITAPLVEIIVAVCHEASLGRRRDARPSPDRSVTISQRCAGPCRSGVRDV